MKRRTPYPVSNRMQSNLHSFGMLMKEGTFSSGDYRYGFNGKEKTDEINGEGAVYDYGFRIYDSRLSRFLSVDPLSSKFSWWSPYAFAGNTPIVGVDLDGLELILPRIIIPEPILTLPKATPIIPPGEIVLPPTIISPTIPPGMTVGQPKVEMSNNPPAGVDWESAPAPEDLGEDWEETTSKDNKEPDTHKEYTNKKTGETVNFDKGNPNKTGWKKGDHYHRRNPISKNKGDYYLDKYGKPCSKGSEASHIRVVRAVVLKEVEVTAKRHNWYQRKWHSIKEWFRKDKEKRGDDDYKRRGGKMS